ncbi:MAG: FtsW/RodA/SpoVE family cell cycle protein [Chloroflexi bacterium]|nr:FtsW/RodA/SpoVE family cell cycle protein [Chloroflexota bacterium]
MLTETLARRWRGTELGLLLFPTALLVVGLALLTLANRQELVWRSFTAGFAFAAFLLATHAWLTHRYPYGDELLLPIAASLCALGQLMVTRLEPDLAIRQSLWVGLGFLAMGATLVLLPSIAWLRRYRYIWAALGLLLVMSTLVFGVDPNGSGARLWLGFGPVLFQPSEILKVLLVVFFASYLDEHRELLAYGGPRLGPIRLPPLPYLAPLLLMLLLSLLLLLWQRDLGAALLFYGIFLAMLYVASGRGLYVLVGILLFAAGATLMYQLFAHVRVRVDTWLDPWATATTTGFQLVQALTALAAGGLFGAGLTFGYPDMVPAIHTDFIIAAIGEELGLAGSLGVVALYMLLVYRGFKIAVDCRDAFAGFLAAGLTSVVGIQSLVILGGTLKLMPLTGVTLPLLSYGGSSILANFIILGLLLAISAEARRPRYAVHD